MLWKLGNWHMLLFIYISDVWLEVCDTHLQG